MCSAWTLRDHSSLAPKATRGMGQKASAPSADEGVATPMDAPRQLLGTTAALPDGIRRPASVTRRGSANAIAEVRPAGSISPRARALPRTLGAAAHHPPHVGDHQTDPYWDLS
jgi:hypothetical protein